MSTVNDLKAARELIASRKKWVKGVEIKVENFEGAIDSEDLMELFLHIGSSEKTCFCASGAIRYVTGNNPTRYNSAIKALAEVLPKDPDEDYLEECYEHLVTQWNDDDVRTHKEVVSAFDSAIKQREVKSWKA